MQEFEYLRPTTVDGLVALLARTGGTLLAGGTDLLPRLRHDAVTVSCLVDAGQVADLRFIRQEAGWLEIGAATTHADLEASALVRAWAPALAQAASLVGSPQTRQLGTLGGNLANASPAADTAPPLLALEAEACLRSLQGCRRVDLGRFFLGPGRTCLAAGECIEAVRFRLPAGRWGSAFHKVGRRNGMAISVVNAAACLELDGQSRVRAARLALGSVAPCPVRSPHAEAVLIGRPAGPDLFRQAGQAVLDDIAPIADVRASAAYRRRAAAVVTERVLAEALEQAVRRSS